MNPNKLVCLSTMVKMGILFRNILCSCYICILCPHVFSQNEGRLFTTGSAWERYQLYQVHKPFSCSPTRLGIAQNGSAVQPVLLFAPSHRRWGPKELLSGVTAALQCSRLGPEEVISSPWMSSRTESGSSGYLLLHKIQLP